MCAMVYAYFGILHVLRTWLGGSCMPIKRSLLRHVNMMHWDCQMSFKKQCNRDPRGRHLCLRLEAL